MLRMPAFEKALSHGLLDVLIRAGLIAVLVMFCFQIFSPFLHLMLWSPILAITLYPLHRRSGAARQQEIAEFGTIYPMNARPTQQGNGRLIQMTK